MKLSKLALSLIAISGTGYASFSMAAGGIEVLRVIDENQTGAATSCLIMNQGMDNPDNTPKVLASYIKVLNKATGKYEEPEALINDRSVCLSGLAFGTEYQVTLKEGIKAANNTRLPKDISVDFTTIDHQPTVNFLPGNILSRAANEKKVAVESVNMDKFQVALYRMSSSDLASYVSRATDSLEDRWGTIEYLKSHGKFLGAKKYSLNGKLNGRQITMVDLRELGGNVDSGIYTLLITSEDMVPCDNSGECLSELDDKYSALMVAKSVVISDIGLTTYQKSSGIDIAVRSLSTARPLANAKASLVNAANEVIATVMTGKDGYAHFAREAVSGENAQRPVLLNVVKDGDFYSQDLRANPLVIENVKTTSAAQLNPEFNVYAYTNRTLVRPGEKVYYEAIVRDSKLKAASVKALKLMIYRPDGLLQKEVTLSNPASGAFDYEFEFDSNAPLGPWRFALGFDKKNILSTARVTVDNFIPSSIDPKIVTKKTVISKNEPVEIKTKYIYDAPAPGIAMSGSYILLPDNHPSEKYKDYYFGPNQKELENLRNYGGINDVESGSDGGISINLGDLETSDDYPQKIDLSLNFVDPNSKIITRVKSYKLSFPDPLVGIKTDFSKDDVYKSDFSVILADQAGKLYSGKVDYAIYKRNISYQFVYNNGSWNYFQNEYLTPVTAGVMNLKADTSGRIAYTFQDGNYVAKLTHGDRETSVNFYVGSMSCENPKYPDRFELFTDRESYKVNDTAYFEFDSSYSGFADLVLDNVSGGSMFHYEVKKGHNKLPLKITPDFVNGTYAILTTYAAQESKHLGSRRSIGVAYVGMDKSADTLKISAEVPEAKPNNGVDIRIKVDNADSNTYVTAALVDKGILSINNQKAPSPDGALYNQKVFRSQIFDPYSYLMKSVDHNGQGYGDDGAEDLPAETPSLSNITKELLSYYSPKVKVENGYATVHYDLNAISSTASLMVSAWSPDKLGSYAQDVRIRDSAVSRMNMPYYLHKGDTLKADFSINNVSGKEASYSYEITCSGTLKCSDKGKLSVADKAVVKAPVTIDAMQAGDGFVDIKVTSDGYSFSTRKEVAVLNPMSKMQENRVVAINPGKSEKVTFDNVFADGSQASARFGKFPLSDVSKIVSGFLDSETMYGDVFDKSAAGLSIISVLSEMEKSKKGNPKELNRMKKYINDTVAAVQSRIDMYGGISGYFQSWKEQRYALAYSALFLTEANNAGFNVNRTLLGNLKNSLIDMQSDDSDNIAALSMYALARMGVNVKTNAIYKFDSIYEKQKPEIESFAYYADIFGMYGDTERRRMAVEKGADVLKAVNDKYNIVTNSYRVYDDVNFYKELLLYFPYRLNSVPHDALALIRSSINAGNSKKLNGLFSYLNAGGYLNNASKAILVDMSEHSKTPEASQRYSLKNNTVTVSNSSSELAVATVSVSDYVAAETPYNGIVRFTQRYYDRSGKEIKGPINLKVNDDLLVVNEFSFKNAFSGNLAFESKIPSNTMLVNTLTREDIKKRYPALKAEQFGYPDVTRGDAGLVVHQSVNNAKVISFAYVLKAAHKGVSVPLMSSGYISRLTDRTFNAYNETASITVK
jgi:uncharacterized protein YfaS (alpha-2-macroglobulin family)